MDKVREALEECADCLESEVEARWRLPDGTIHPAQQRKYERDLEPVHKAREVLAALSSLRSPESAVGEERERCAKVVDDYRAKYGGDWPALEAIAAAIRAPVDTGEEG